MAEWRLLRGWSRAELRQRLERLSRLRPTIPESPEAMTEANGWNHDGLDEAIGREPAGEPVPGGLFERARRALVRYEFSDTEIVAGHFASGAQVRKRHMLLEIKILGVHYLVGVQVGAVREEAGVGRTVFGYRYDTLEGHIERGSEWFLLEKDHHTGEVGFRIEARWRKGEFPNWWSEVGFHVLAPFYRERWRRRAHARMDRLNERAWTEQRSRRKREPPSIGPPLGGEPPTLAEPTDGARSFGGLRRGGESVERRGAGTTRERNNQG